MAVHIFHNAALIVSFALGAFLFATAAAKDMKMDLRSINEMANSKKGEEDFFKKLTGFVHLFANFKQLSKQP